MESAKALSLQTNSQHYLSQDTVLTNPLINCQLGIEMNPNSDPPKILSQMDDHQTCPPMSFPGNQLDQSFSGYSNAKNAEDPDSPYSFPHYQLSGNNTFEKRYDQQEDVTNNSYFQNVDCAPDIFLDDCLNDLNGFPPGCPPHSAGFSAFRHSVTESLPIDIQSSGTRETHNPQYFPTAPASDIRGGSCSNFGSTSSTPGRGSIYQQQPEIFHSNLSNPTLSFENPNHQIEKRFSVNSAHSGIAVQATEDVNLSSIDALSLDDRLSTSTQPLLPDVTNEMLDDVVFEEPSDSHQDSNLLVFDIQMKGSAINIPYNQQSRSGPPQRAASTSSFSNVRHPHSHMVQLSSHPMDGQRFEQESNHFRMLSEKHKADQRRIKNNLACKKARQKRKKIKQETEARINHLTMENTQLKEKILALESEKEKYKAVFPHSCVTTTDLTYFQQ